MIFTIGTDIIETQGMREAAVGGIDPAQTIFTDREVNYCDSKRRPFEHYAARYAAKGAALKALGAGGRKDLELREMEVIDDERGNRRCSCMAASRSCSNSSTSSRPF